jgi:preprotein translocase subunit SecG
MSAYLPAKRPFAVTLVFWGVILFGIWNVSKAAALVGNSQLLLARGVQPDPRLQAVLAVGWAILFLVVAWGLRRKRPSTQHTIPLLLLVYGLYTLGIRLIFSPLPLGSGDWILSTLFFLTAAVLAYLALKRAGRRHYFVERRI